VSIAQYIYIAVGIILAAAGVTGVIWWHNDIERSCEARVAAADQSQVIKQLQIDNAQKAKDLNDAVTAVSQLESDKRSLAVALTAARSNVNPLRLCGTAHGSGALPSAGSAAAEPQPSSSGSPSIPGVSEGSGAGTIGQTELQDLAFAGAIAASAYRSTFQWANDQSVN
jgi:hypothetical protein